MRALFAILLCTITNIALGQKFDVSAGINFSKFYEHDRHNLGQFSSSYNTRPGYVARFGLNHVKLRNTITRVDLTIENYGGQIDVSDGGRGGSYGTIGDVRKTNIALAWFPINVTFYDSLRFTSGISVSNLIHEKVSGKYTYNVAGRGEIYDIDTDYKLYNSIVLFGVRAGLAKTYFYSLRHGINFQYTIDLGLTREFAYYPGITRSVRHSFTIGFQKRDPDFITPAFN